MSNFEIVISSGNVLNSTISFGKGNEVATGELFETLRSCVIQNEPMMTNSVAVAGSHSPNNSVLEIEGQNEQNVAVDEPVEDRGELKVSVKVFVYSVQDIHAVIQRALKQVGQTYLDTVVLSFATAITLDTLKVTWKMLETEVGLGTIKMIGLSDIDTELFAQLYEEAVVKPSVIQINLASCCVVPVPLQEFCKVNDIQLLTHADPLDILPAERLVELSKSFKDQDRDCMFDIKWVLRYQIHLKCRGVISKKGYIVSIGSNNGN